MKTNIKGIAPEWYTLEEDQDDPEPVQFYIRPLDGFAAMEVAMLSLSGRATSRAEAARAGSEVLKTAFRLGVKDWRNIGDADNPDRPLAYSAAAMSSFPPGWIMEVGARVMELSELRSAEKKISGSP